MRNRILPFLILGSNLCIAPLGIANSISESQKEPAKSEEEDSEPTEPENLYSTLRELKRRATQTSSSILKMLASLHKNLSVLDIIRVLSSPDKISQNFIDIHAEFCDKSTLFLITTKSAH